MGRQSQDYSTWLSSGSFQLSLKIKPKLKSLEKISLLNALYTFKYISVNLLKTATVSEQGHCYDKVRGSQWIIWLEESGYGPTRKHPNSHNLSVPITHGQQSTSNWTSLEHITLWSRRMFNRNSKYIQPHYQSDVIAVFIIDDNDASLYYYQCILYHTIVFVSCCCGRVVFPFPS